MKTKEKRGNLEAVTHTHTQETLQNSFIQHGICLLDYIYIEQFIQKRNNKLNNKIKGGNTFICNKRKDRLDLDKSKS